MLRKHTHSLTTVLESCYIYVERSSSQAQEGLCTNNSFVPHSALVVALQAGLSDGACVCLLHMQWYTPTKAYALLPIVL